MQLPFSSAISQPDLLPNNRMDRRIATTDIENDIYLLEKDARDDASNFRRYVKSSYKEVPIYKSMSSTP